MKFLADMGISYRSVNYLSDLGHDALHISELGDIEKEDAEILAQARLDTRVVLTNDLDFGDLLALSGESLPSVVIFRLQDMTSANVNRYLDDILARYSAALNEGVIVSVSEKRIRIRKLPIERF
jgi:predicted nuclease of predicted toxin-antitoxin system